MKNFHDVGAKERDVDDQKGCCEWKCEPAAPIPEVTEHEVKEHRGRDHCAGDGDAVSRSKLRGFFEAQNESDTADHQEVVYLRDVNLPLG